MDSGRAGFLKRNALEVYIGHQRTESDLYGTARSELFFDGIARRKYHKGGTAFARNTAHTLKAAYAA